ncbi:MAG: sigma-70 family RNA polymerase sigma factor [Butyricicoccus pullicaecorum]|nr:sigma-70 family RNA polymerase sigma factor [Butyricicoccus pullicaecorum]
MGISQAQFAQVFQAKKEKYYRIAYSYAKNEHDALDIVGEAAYRGLKSLHTLKAPEYLDTWITRIVFNVAIDLMRERSRLIFCEDTVLEVVAVPEKELIPEDSMDLFKALDALSEKDRVCVTLRYFEEYTFLEISKVLQEPESTVKSRLYRALHKMRLYLEKGGTDLERGKRVL